MNSPLIQSTALAILEKMVNQALQLDPGTRQRMTELSGRRIKVSCTAPLFSMTLIPDARGIMLQSNSPDDEPAPDCEIKGDSASLLRLLTAKNKVEALFNPGIELSGNTEIAQALQAALTDLDIDWEEKLSHWIGDMAAHQIGNQARQLLYWGRQTFDSLLMNIEEYLHEEARAMPPRLELSAFYDDIEQLTVATDRLAARLQRLDRLYQETEPTQKESLR